MNAFLDRFGVVVQADYPDQETGVARSELQRLLLDALHEDKKRREAKR